MERALQHASVVRWDPGHKSDDVIDRRGEEPPRGVSGAGGLLRLAPLLLRFRHGWVVLLVLAAIVVLGGYFANMLGGDVAERAPSGSAPGVAQRQTAGRDVEFVSYVLDDVQSVWRKLLTERHIVYRNAKLVLFTGATRTSCGFGEAATGPFYCPTDERVYLDLSFFGELSSRFRAPGDFAQAYVVAHEIGHHVQNLLGVSDRVHRAPASKQRGADGLSVRLELQADCYAGVWGSSTDKRQLLDRGDIEEGLRAAAAIGDDRLQRQATGTVQPESWTHGSSAQRSRWFRAGLDSGNMEACDTFSTSHL